MPPWSLVTPHHPRLGWSRSLLFQMSSGRWKSTTHRPYKTFNTTQGEHVNPIHTAGAVFKAPAQRMGDNRPAIFQIKSADSITLTLFVSFLHVKSLLLEYFTPDLIRFKQYSSYLFVQLIWIIKQHKQWSRSVKGFIGKWFLLNLVSLTCFISPGTVTRTKTIQKYKSIFPIVTT